MNEKAINDYAEQDARTLIRDIVREFEQVIERNTDKLASLNQEIGGGGTYYVHICDLLRACHTKAFVQRLDRVETPPWLRDACKKRLMNICKSLEEDSQGKEMQ